MYDLNHVRIPGPRSNLYGRNFYSIVMEARKNKRATKAMVDILLPAVGDGNICASNLFGTKLFILAHPDYVKVALTGSHTKFPKSKKYDRLKFILGEGLVTSSGAKWQAHRTMISPGFHAEALKNMPAVFSKHTNHQIQRWLESCKESSTGNIKIEMCKDITELTLAIICDSGFGYRFDQGTSQAVINYFIDLNDEMNMKIMDPFDWWPIFSPNRR